MEFTSAIALLFLIMDPFGNMVTFNSILEAVEPRRRVWVILREALIAYGILLLFLLAGANILAFLGLEQPALSISGAIILFLIALGMVFPDRAVQVTAGRDSEPFIVPLAMPLIAGPSAIAMLLLFSTREPDRWWEWFGALTVAWFLSSALLTLSPWLFTKLGRRGSIAVERLMGMLLVMVSIQMFLDGIEVYIEAHS